MNQTLLDRLARLGLTLTLLGPFGIASPRCVPSAPDLRTAFERTAVNPPGVVFPLTPIESGELKSAIQREVFAVYRHPGPSVRQEPRRAEPAGPDLRAHLPGNRPVIALVPEGEDLADMAWAKSVLAQRFDRKILILHQRGSALAVYEKTSRLYHERPVLDFDWKRLIDPLVVIDLAAIAAPSREPFQLIDRDSLANTLDPRVAGTRKRQIDDDLAHLFRRLRNRGVDFRSIVIMASETPARGNDLLRYAAERLRAAVKDMPETELVDLLPPTLWQPVRRDSGRRPKVEPIRPSIAHRAIHPPEGSAKEIQLAPGRPPLGWFTVLRFSLRAMLLGAIPGLLNVDFTQAFAGAASMLQVPEPPLRLHFAARRSA
jgi:hypothetical protein